MLDEFYLNLMARLSTTFSRSQEPGKYHSHWANPHRDILEKMKSGDRHGAEGLLRIHLDDSEASTLDLARSVGEGRSRTAPRDRRRADRFRVGSLTVLGT